jgi:hypothetical protein
MRLALQRSRSRRRCTANQHLLVHPVGPGDKDIGDRGRPSGAVLLPASCQGKRQGRGRREGRDEPLGRFEALKRAGPQGS